MEIFIVFKTYRQDNGEYYAVETEAAFTKKEDAEAFLNASPIRAWEKKEVPLNTGGTMPVDFFVLRGVHPTELRGL